MLKKNALLLFLFLFLSARSLSSVLRLTTFAAIDDSCQNVSSLSLDAAISCQEQVQKELDSLKNAIKPNAERLEALKLDIKSIISRTVKIEEGLKEKSELLKKGKDKIAVQKKIFDAKVRSFYKRQKHYSPILFFFAKSQNLADFSKEFAYQQKTTAEDKKNITSIALYVKDVEEKKEELENENSRLSNLKIDLSRQIGELEQLLAGATSYQKKLTDTVARLSARQQEIIAARIGSLHLPTSLGGGPLICTDDRQVDPGFRPAFAFFTFGIPHRAGMNQYGAKGRAESGQNAEQILAAYFPNTELKKDWNTGVNINVSGNNEFGQSFNLSWDLETYVKHIYEMPSSWHPEALKAQAVAARSYALAYTSNGNSAICATQQCQVVKREENAESWRAAVDATRGWVLVNGGSPISAWFASTSGGYTWGSGDVWCESTYTGSCSSKPWTGRSRDTSGEVSSLSDLMSKSYDKESPCFYSAQGWRSEYGKTAWLKSEEVADIINVLLLVKRDSGTADHLYQPDKPHPDGGEVWNMERVKQELRNRGGNPFNSVGNISVNFDFGGGRTTSINVSGDAGSQSFEGLEFKSYFSLRAPANISIVGPLYNIEKR